MGKNRPCSFIPLCIVGEHECCYLKACCTNVHNDGKHDEDFEGWMGNFRLLCATGNLLRNVKTDLPFFVSLSLAYSFPLNVSLPIFSQLLLVCVHVCGCAVAPLLGNKHLPSALILFFPWYSQDSTLLPLHIHSREWIAIGWRMWEGGYCERRSTERASGGARETLNYGLFLVPLPRFLNLERCWFVYIVI